jgi:nitronate monooxygenase
MRADALKAGDVDRMQAWAGQGAALARAEPAAAVFRRLWDEGRAHLTAGRS